MDKQFMRRRVIFGIGCFVFLIGLSGILGWIYKVPEFKSILPYHPVMKFNSAISMCLCGLAVMLLGFKSNPTLRIIIISIIFIPLLIAETSLIENLLQLNLGLDQLLMKDSESALNLGRMSPTVAFCFVTITTSIVLFTQTSFRKIKKPIVAALAATTLFISTLLLMSFFPNVSFEESTFHYSKMELPTSASFILLSCAVLMLLKNKKNFKWSLIKVVTITCVWVVSFLLVLSPLGFLFSILICFIGLFMMNASRMAQRKMKAKQEQFAEIVNSSNDAIIGMNLQGKILSWNAGAEQIYGYSASEVIGKFIHEFIPEDRQQEETEVLNNIRNGIKVEHYNTVRLKKDGKPIYVSLTVSPIKNEQDKIIGASKIVRDITEMKQMEQQLRQGQKLKAIGELAGGVAHDFNNLLGIILGNLDLLERKLIGNDEACKRVQNALKAATRGADLTKRLLAFSRMQQLTPADIVVGDSVKNVVEMASLTLGEEIKISIQLESNLPHIFIDPTEFESALLNLVVNARDAMPKGGSIIISAKTLHLNENAFAVHAGELKPGFYVSVSVTDSGTGIPPEILERIFEPFFTTKPKGKGTGMGLAMVYGFMKQSGGFVKIYTEPGHGTTISLYIPVSAQSKIRAFKAEPIGDVQISGKVLAVDDELELLEITALYLKEMGFEVLHAADAKSALEIFQQNTDIKILITDIMMHGGMNGLELAKKIKEIKNDIAVIYTSGFPAGNIAKSEPLQINELLLNKPYNRETLISTIRHAINANPTK